MGRARGASADGRRKAEKFALQRRRPPENVPSLRSPLGPDADAAADDVPIMQNALCHRADSAEIKWNELAVSAGTKHTQSVASSRRKRLACIPRHRRLNRMFLFILIAFRLLSVMVIIIGPIHITTFSPLSAPTRILFRFSPALAAAILEFAFLMCANLMLV